MSYARPIAPLLVLIAVLAYGSARAQKFPAHWREDLHVDA